MPKLALLLAIGLSAVMLDGAAAPVAEAQPATAKAKPTNLAPGCLRRTARGSGPTRHHARLKSWELIAQSTGNWPLAKDQLKNERYACREQGNGWRCVATIDVCKRV